MFDVKKIHKDGWYLSTLYNEVVIYHQHSQGYWLTAGYCKTRAGTCLHVPPTNVIAVWNLAGLKLKGLSL